jgi:hypothetical protein
MPHKMLRLLLTWALGVAAGGGMATVAPGSDTLKTPRLRPVGARNSARRGVW